MLKNSVLKIIDSNLLGHISAGDAIADKVDLSYDNKHNVTVEYHYETKHVDIVPYMVINPTTGEQKAGITFVWPPKK